MAKEKVYWTTKDGRKLDIDTMDESHVRNCLKMIVRMGVLDNYDDNYDPKYNQDDYDYGFNPLYDLD